MHDDGGVEAKRGEQGSTRAKNAWLWGEQCLAQVESLAFV